MLCGFGNNTKERVMDTFVTNNLVSPQPRADGSFYVTKIEEFDRENKRLSEEMLREHNILNYFWVREGNTARFSDTVAHLVDVVSERNPVKVITDAGFHGGNLQEKSDYLTRGYYGDLPFTGYYFFSDQGRAQNRGNRSRSPNSDYSVVDFSQYNLLKPTVAGYWALKSNLKKIVKLLDKGVSMVDITGSFKYDISPTALGSYEVYNEFKDKAGEIDAAYKNFIEATQADGFQRVERFETTMLKIAGFEGIDVRGLLEAGGMASPDSSTEGSVIFDLKPDTFETISEVSKSPGLPDIIVPSNWKSPC